MKQQSPLRKKQNYVQTSKVDFTQIHEHINKPTPAQLDARRRDTDEALGHSLAPKESNPIREVARTFVGGFGLGVAVVAIIFGLVGANPLPYALGAVMCLLGYLYLDGE